MTAIAIDGPAGAGKSTIARALARKLGYIYVDTGALYRSIGLYCAEAGVPLEDKAAVTAALEQIRVELRYVDGVQRVLLNGRDVSEEIRRPEISLAASSVSAMDTVRAFLFDLQRNMALEHDVVMDGRDIGTVVLPDAQVKIYLTASAEERTRRRMAEYEAKGMHADFEELLREVNLRDEQDRNRAVAPLRKAEDAVELDSTSMDAEEVLAAIETIVKEKRIMWLYYFAKAVCMIAFNLWYKLEYHGLENIPAGGGYILMGNHRSMIDPIILAHKAHGQVRYMGKMELFRNPILGWALRTIGTFPVDRGAGDTSAIDNSRKVIEEGDILGIFPEGHRSKTGEPLRPKSGVALVARLTEAPVLPCSVYWEGKLGFRRKIVIRYGELIPYETMGLTESSSARDLRNATQLLFGKVLESIEVSKNEY